MNIKKIIEDIGKYHYVLINNKTAAIMSSNNKLSDAKNNVLDTIKKNLDELIGQTIVQLKIKEIKKSLKEKGPISFELTFYIVNKNGNLTISQNHSNEILYITEKYLNNNDKIKKKDVNIQDKNGDTILIKSSSWSYKINVKKLLQQNVDVNIQNNDGYTALIKASDNGIVEIVQMLLNKNIIVI